MAVVPGSISGYFTVVAALPCPALFGVRVRISVRVRAKQCKQPGDPVINPPILIAGDKG